MKIEEAIIHARQVADGCASGSDCAYQHDKLADWLEELVALRKERYAQAHPDPLTIDELRKMNGQPVWCADINEWGIVKIETIGRWANDIFLIGHYGNEQVRTNYEYDIVRRCYKCYRSKPNSEVCLE